MTKAKIKLFIIDRDAIYRLGLRTAIARYPDFEIVGEGNVSNDTLRELTQGLVLNVLVIGINVEPTESMSALDLTQQIQQLYPQLPLFLLTPKFSARQSARLKSWGIEGSCDRLAGIDTIVEGLYTVAYGNSYWQQDPPPQLWQQALGRLSKNGRIELERTLQEIEARLESTSLSDWERVFLVGRKRELLTARWLSRRLVAESITLNEDLAIATTASEIVPLPPTQLATLPVFTDSANKTIFERVATDLQIGLYNRTDVLLEIDLLQPEVQKNLCQLILKRIYDTVAQIPIAETIDRQYEDYLNNLWSWSASHFFRQYYGDVNSIEEEQLNELIAREWLTLQRNIFDYIYGLPELMEYLLGKPQVIIDNVVYQSDAAEAVERIEFLLHNLVIHLANGVVQVILNDFYDLEIFKYRLYKAQYRSDRQLARFRNQLSWKYRQEQYFTQPQDIFESRYRLFVLNGGTIRKIYIYASRRDELAILGGIPWFSTIVIEFRDAIAPLVRRFIALAGTGVVFVLTQVIGKGLGLIGKGIIQGIGNTIKDVPRSKKKPRV